MVQYFTCCGMLMRMNKNEHQLIIRIPWPLNLPLTIINHGSAAEVALIAAPTPRPTCPHPTAHFEVVAPIRKILPLRSTSRDLVETKERTLENMAHVGVPKTSESLEFLWQFGSDTHHLMVTEKPVEVWWQMETLPMKRGGSGRESTMNQI